MSFKKSFFDIKNFQFFHLKNIKNINSKIILKNHFLSSKIFNFVDQKFQKCLSKVSKVPIKISIFDQKISKVPIQIFKID